MANNERFNLMWKSLSNGSNITLTNYKSNPKPPLRSIPQMYRCLYVVALMAMFWVTEVVPLPITGLFPVFLYPLMGVMDTAGTCNCYMNDTTMMFVGSLVIAVAIEHSGLHMRVALIIIKTIGCSHRK